MNFLDMLLNDPVVLISFTGLAFVLAICAYYIYYFIKNIQQDK